MASGTKRTRLVCDSSRALPALLAKSKLLQLASDAATLNCQLPCVLSTALTAMCLGTLPVSTSMSLKALLAMMSATAVPALPASAVSSLMALRWWLKLVSSVPLLVRRKTVNSSLVPVGLLLPPTKILPSPSSFISRRM